jgi:DNA-binding NarL/FixJ family response regulator
MISILLVDDHPLVLRGLSDLFLTQANFLVVGQETDALRATEKAVELSPNVMVLDLMMPGVNGLEVIKQVAKQCPSTRIVVLSMHANPAYVWEALRNGAIAYVLKSAKSEELIHAVREASKGRRYLSPPLSNVEVDEYSRRAQQSQFDSYEMLTNRERQVLQMAAEGLTNSQIAERLKIGIRSVETHRANLLRKLNLHGQTELVRYAMQRGIVASD